MLNVIYRLQIPRKQYRTMSYPQSVEAAGIYSLESQKWKMSLVQTLTRYYFVIDGALLLLSSMNEG